MVDLKCEKWTVTFEYTGDVADRIDNVKKSGQRFFYYFLYDYSTYLLNLLVRRKEQANSNDEFDHYIVSLDVNCVTSLCYTKATRNTISKTFKIESDCHTEEVSLEDRLH